MTLHTLRRETDPDRRNTTRRRYPEGKSLSAILAHPSINSSVALEIWKGFSVQGLNNGATYGEAMNRLFIPGQEANIVDTQSAPSSQVTNPDQGIPMNSMHRNQTVGIIIENSDEIFRHVHRITADRELAAEIVQEVALKGLSTPPEEDSNIKAWAHRSARNLAIDQLRRRKLIHWENIEEIREERVPQDIDNPEQSALRQEEIAEVYDAILGMQPRNRFVFVLQYYGDVSGKAISDILGISYGRIKHIFMEVRDDFKTQLSSMTGD